MMYTGQPSARRALFEAEEHHRLWSRSWNPAVCSLLLPGRLTALSGSSLYNEDVAQHEHRRRVVLPLYATVVFPIIPRSCLQRQPTAIVVRGCTARLPQWVAKVKVSLGRRNA